MKRASITLAYMARSCHVSHNFPKSVQQFGLISGLQNHQIYVNLKTKSWIEIKIIIKIKISNVLFRCVAIRTECYRNPFSLIAPENSRQSLWTSSAIVPATKPKCFRWFLIFKIWLLPIHLPDSLRHNRNHRDECQICIEYNSKWPDETWTCPHWSGRPS